MPALNRQCEKIYRVHHRDHRQDRGKEELSEEIRNKLFGMHSQNKHNKTISKQSDVTVSTIADISKKLKVIHKII